MEVANLNISFFCAEPIDNPQAIKVYTTVFEALQMQDTFQCQTDRTGNVDQLGICEKYCFPSIKNTNKLLCNCFLYFNGWLFG